MLVRETNPQTRYRNSGKRRNGYVYIYMHVGRHLSIYLDGGKRAGNRDPELACLHLQEGKNAAVGRTITRRFVDQVLHTDGMSEVPLMTVPC